MWVEGNGFKGPIYDDTSLNNALFIRETLQNHHAFTLFHSPPIFWVPRNDPPCGGPQGEALSGVRKECDSSPRGDEIL